MQALLSGLPVARIVAVPALHKARIVERRKNLADLDFNSDVSGQVELEGSHPDLDIRVHGRHARPIAGKVQGQVAGASNEIQVTTMGIAELFTVELRRPNLEGQ